MRKQGSAKAGVLITAAFLFSGAVASAQNKKPPPPKDDRERVNCIIVSRYDPDTPPELRGPGGKATNQDRKDAAANLKSQYDHEADATKTPTEVNEVNGDDNAGNPVNTYEIVFDKLKQNKKCCRRLDILAHGGTDGGLELPYNMPVTKKESDAGGVPPRNEIGGPNGRTGLGQKWLDQFSSQVKSLLCPDPMPKTVKMPDPPVSLYACYTSDVDASNGFPISQQLAKAVDANVRGYTKTCDYNHDPENPSTVFHPTGETGIYDPKGNMVPEPGTDDSVKKDEPNTPPDAKKDEPGETPKIKKAEPLPKTDGPRRTTKSGMKATKKATQSTSSAKPEDHAMSPDESRALGTAIGIGVGIGLGMGRGGGDRDRMRDR